MRCFLQPSAPVLKFHRSVSCHWQQPRAQASALLGSAITAHQYSSVQPPTPRPIWTSSVTKNKPFRGTAFIGRPVHSHSSSGISNMERGAPTCTGVSLHLWNSSIKHALRSLYCPFVVALAQGTLPRESFQHYVQQDVFFLDHFAQAYQLCIDKAKGLPDSVQARLHYLLDGVVREKRLHASYAQKWGVDIDVCQPNKACKAYTDFLLYVATTSQSLDRILAAMIPCSRLYGFLGVQLANAYGIDEASPYADWIRTYSSADYLALPALKEQLLDDLGGSTPVEELQALYDQAMLLELDFFCAQPQTPPPRRLRVLITDFDDTCTARDSSAVLLRAAVQASSKSEACDLSDSAASIVSKQATAAQLEHNYISKYTKLMDRLLPEAQAPAGTIEEFFWTLSEFDQAMNAVVIDSGMLQGLRLDDIREAGVAMIQLQAGCKAALASVYSAAIPLHVVTLNWSSVLVTAALGHLPFLQQGSSTETAPGTTHQGSIFANDLTMDENGVSDGGMLRKVESGLGKLRILTEDILPRYAAQEGISVYLGDSPSDLPSLLAVDIGIVIGRSKTLRRVTKAYGIALKPLCTAPLVADRRSPADWASNKVLYEVDDWSNIEAFLFNHSASTPARTPSPGNGTGNGTDARTAASPRSRVGAAAAVGSGFPTTSVSATQAHGSSSSSATVSPVPRVLTIAGSDSGGGAGIQADLKVFLARGVFGMSAVTALTSQNTHGVHGVHKPPLDFVEQQIDCVLSDLGADVVKTGMLPDAPTVSLVARKVRQYNVSRLVVDPVITSTSGHSLAESDVAQSMKQELFPLATIVTPNIPEASALLGGVKIQCVQDMKEAARRLHELGMQYVLLKGGHLAPDGAGGEAVDVLFDGREVLELRHNFVNTRNTHGTGCTLASAIASELAKGGGVREAVAAAKTYLSKALERSAGLSIGTGVQRPFNHGFEIADWTTSGQPRLDLRVYAVTDPVCNKKTNRSMEEAVEAALKGGATIVQVRNKDADGAEFLKVAKTVLRVAKPYNVPVMINDRVDIALASGADGVHVGQSDLPAAEVRRLLGPHKLLGVSAKTVQEAQAAQAAGADYVGTGAVFPTNTKDTTVLGLETLAEVCTSISIPVVAIGGITIQNAASAVHAGCAGVAVVSNIFAAPDPVAATQALREVVDKALGAKQ